MTSCIAVVTANMAELTHLASYLAHTGRLSFYGSGLVAPSRTELDQRYRWLPMPVRDRAARRGAPDGVEAYSRQSYAVLEEVARACIPARFPRARRQLMDRRSRRIGQGAGRTLMESRADALVISHGTALEAFRAGGDYLKVLNMPSVHPRYRTALVEDELKRYPELATGLRHDLPPRRLLRRFDEEFALADMVLVGSRFAGDTLIEHGVDPGRIRVVPYGAPTDEPMPSQASQIRSGVLHTLYLGRLSQSKGLSYLLDAHNQMSGVHLTVVGGAAEGAAAFRSPGDTWTHVPAVPRSAVSSLLASADVFVLPSLFEGMSLAVLEAMSAGLPVIVTPSSGVSDVVRDGVEGFIVPSRDPEALRAALTRLRDDPSLRWTMGQSAHARAVEFTWSRYAATVVAAIDERLLAGTQP